MATYLGRIQLLAKPASEWAASDPVLLSGEIGAQDVGSSTPVLKIGDGVRPWSMLPNLLGGGGGGGGGVTFADPTAKIGIAAVNGAASSAMRSDAAPALDLAISPTWTGSHTYELAPNVAGVSMQNAALFTSGTLGVARGGTGISSFAGPNYIRAAGSTTLEEVTPSQVLADIGAAPAAHTHAASDITSGTLTVARGGTGASTLTGYVKGNGAGAFTASATIPYSDLSGAPAIPTVPVAANPSASVGLAAVNGVAATFMRSDAAPALSQAIAPVWTGAHTFKNQVVIQADGTNQSLSVTPSALTFGNTANNPTYTFLGTGVAKFSGPIHDLGYLRVCSAYGQSPASDPLGPAVEIGYVTGQNAFLYAYNRTGGAYVALTMDAASTDFKVAGATKAYVFSNGLAADNLVKMDQSKQVNFTPVTYGTIAVTGASNGYHGVQVYEGVLNPTFMSNGTAYGIFSQADGRWLINRDSATAASVGYGLTAPSFNISSSRTLKRETGAPAPAHVRDVLRKLRVHLYRLIADPTHEQIGGYAEEVHEVCPWLSHDGKTITLDRLAWLLLADWQERDAHG